MAAITAGVIAAVGAAYAADSEKKSAKAATKSQEKQVAQNRAFLQQKGGQAGHSAKSLFRSAEASQRLGQKQAFDVLSGALPEQLGTFQQGNIGAQQALLGGLPAAESAILGTGQRLRLQPTKIRPDLGFVPSGQQFGPSIGQALFATGTPGLRLAIPDELQTNMTRVIKRG